MTGDNPFSASSIDPRLPSASLGNDRAIRRWAERLHRSGEPLLLVGPHGCGKSTLLEAIRHACVSNFPAWETQTICADRVSFRFALGKLATRRSILWFVDGADRWSDWQQRLFGHIATAKHDRVLGTSHRPGPWSVLAQLKPTLEQLDQIVRRKLVCRTELPTGLLKHLYDYHNGNYRDVMFDLYDWWEAQHGRHPDRRTLPCTLQTFANTARKSSSIKRTQTATD